MNYSVRGLGVRDAQSASSLRDRSSDFAYRLEM